GARGVPEARPRGARDDDGSAASRGREALRGRALEMKRAALFAAIALLALAPPVSASKDKPAAGGDVARAGRARDALMELDVVAGRAVLDGADPADPALAIERARLAIYEGAYDAAAQILARGDLAGTQEGAELVEIARGCARSMAAALVVDDVERGVIVRLQD